MTLDKRRDAFYKDDGEDVDDYDDDDADCDDGEYVDEEGVAYNDETEEEQIKYVSKTTARVPKTSRRSTKGRQLKRWDGKNSLTHTTTNPKCEC